MKRYFFTLAAMAAMTLGANAQFVIEMNNGTTENINGQVHFSESEGEWSVGETYNAALDLGEIAAITIAPQKPAAKVGDFFYSDGTWSSTLDSEKTPIGIVFWTGNPTEQDAALKAAFPGCTNGLVVGLKQKQCEWQDYYSDFEDEVGITVGDWIAENTGYASIESGFGINAPINKTMGYNNTMGLDEFNDSDYGWDYEVLAASNVSSTMTGFDAPSTTSGWFVPSAKEVSLLISGPYDGDIDDIGYLDEPLVANMAIINASLAQIPGAAAIDGVYWTSNESTIRQVFTIRSANALLMETSKGGSNLLRPILAF